MIGRSRRPSDHLRERRSHPSIFNRHNEFGETDVERTHDVSHCHPMGICLAALDACERGDSDAGTVGKVLLRAPTVAAHLAKSAGETLVCGVVQGQRSSVPLK
jgi:hypothetical protein